MTAHLTDKFGALVKSIEVLAAGQATEHKIELAMRRISSARAAELLPHLEAMREVDKFFEGLHFKLTVIQIKRDNQ